MVSCSIPPADTTLIAQTSSLFLVGTYATAVMEASATYTTSSPQSQAIRDARQTLGSLIQSFRLEEDLGIQHTDANEQTLYTAVTALRTLMPVRSVQGNTDTGAPADANTNNQNQNGTGGGQDGQNGVMVNGVH